MLGVLQVKVEGYWQEFWKILGGEACHWQDGGGTPPLNRPLIRGLWSDRSACSSHECSVTSCPSLATSEQKQRVTLPPAGRRQECESLRPGLGVQETRAMPADVSSSTGDSETHLYLLLDLQTL